MKTAKMIIDRDYTLASTDEKLFCSFVEPLGRCIYGGLYEPGHPSADEKGFRRDVLDLIRTAESYAGQTGSQAVILHVEKKNTSAMRFYERMGYSIFRDDGDRYLLKKDI